MGNINVSNVNTLIEGETLGYCYDIYRIMELDNNEYFKVEDLSDFDIKKAVEPVLVKSENAKRLYKLIIKINHPNITRYEYFVDDGLFYVVREYNDDYYAFAFRLKIQRHLQARRMYIDIEEEQIIYWLKQLLMAVECLHRHNILHKFITPECMSFKKDKLKLFMPASSEILPHPDAYVRQEQIWYKCPEHLATGKIGLKYDIWCVGWTLFAICNLEDSRVVLDMVEDYNTWEVPSIRRFYTREVDRIFKRMVKFKPNFRVSARDLLQDEIFHQLPPEPEQEETKPVIKGLLSTANENL